MVASFNKLSPAAKLFYSYLFLFCPVIGCFARNFGVIEDAEATTLIKVMYDAFFVIFCLMLSTVFFKDRYLQHIGKLIYLLLAIGTIFLAKYIFQYESGVDFFWQPLFMEIKPFYYLVVSLVIYIALGNVDRQFFIQCIIFISILMIFGWFVNFFLVGNSAARASVIEESNYDACLLIFGILCLEIERPKHYWLYHLIIAVALLLTLSRTGYVSAAVVYAAFLYRNKRYAALIAISVVALAVIYALYSLRFEEVDSVQDIDRLRMWLSFQDVRESADLFQKYFGFFPGIPIRYYDPFIQYFIEWQSEEQWKILGLHAFNFHAMHIRLALTWGSIGYGFFVVFSLYVMIMRNFYARLLVVVMLIQGTSMGVVYLTTVAVPFYIFMFSAISGKLTASLTNSGGRV